MSRFPYLVALSIFALATLSSYATEDVVSSGVCKRTFDDARSLRIVDAYEKLLVDFQASVSEAVWLESLSSNLKEDSLFQFGSVVGDSYGRNRLFAELERLVASGKYPDRVAFDPESLRERLRGVLERLQKSAEKRAVTVERAVETWREIDHGYRVIPKNSIASMWEQGSRVDAAFKNAFFLSTPDEFMVVDAVKGVEIRRIKNIPKNAQFLGADPQLTVALLKEPFGKENEELWDLANGVPLRKIEGKVVAHDFSRDRGIIARSDGAGFDVLGLRSGEIQEHWPADLSQMKIERASMDSSGKKVLLEVRNLQGGFEGLRIWDSEKKTWWSSEAFGKAKWDSPPSYAGNSDFSRVFEEFVETGPDGKPRTFAQLLGPKGPIATAEFLPGARLRRNGREAELGKIFLTSPGSETIEAFDFKTGRKLYAFEDIGGKISTFKITPDGKSALASSGAGATAVYDLETGKVIHLLEAHSGWIFNSAFSADSKFAVTATGADIKVWDLSTGKLRRSFQHLDTTIAFLAISPDARHAMVGSRDQAIAIWDLEKMIEH